MSPSIREVDDAVDEVIGLLKDQHRKKLQEKGLTLRSLITDFLTLCTQHKRKQKFEHGVTRGTISGGKTFDEWIKEIEKGTKSWGDELRDHASRMADDILRGADSADRNRSDADAARRCPTGFNRIFHADFTGCASNYHSAA